MDRFPAQGIEDADIAIIGMAGRFPGADSVEQLWPLLRQGLESIRQLSEEECRAGGVEPALLRDPAWVRAAAFPSEVESFDAAFFDMPPREAELTDPQHRLFLECAWEALESAGYARKDLPFPVSVFGGATLNTYLLLNLARSPRVLQGLDPVQLNIGNGGDFLTTRVAYKLNLRGASHTVQSACSTSLVAVHLACQSLLNEECDMALAGGVSVNLSLRHGYRYLEGGMTSPDGRCRPFDARAQGTLFSSGVGLVVLKRLRAAVEDGDCVRAVIKGSAINNDGALKAGYTAPSVEGQAQVISEALGASGLDADDISYVEAHGTATPLGDPIEVQALTRAFRASSQRRRYCALGSVKGNLGHLDAAAGVTGLIKTALALEHQELPPSLHFERPNPAIDFDSSPFYVNASLQPWPAGSAPRRAGVSSFGVGGTNAHVIVEEAPRPQPGSAGREWKLLPLSARTPAALEAATSRLATWLREHPACDLADVAWTLQAGRERFEHRRFLLCRSVEEALQRLADPQRLPTEAQERAERPVAFLFPGQGTQHVGMGRELYQAEPTFRAEVERCCKLLERHLKLDLRTLLYPPEDKAEAAAQQLGQTALTQPALFVTEYALARLYMSWGLQPDCMIGHSIGEYVAACLAGVFSLEEALRLVAVRGRLMQGLPSGAMLAVPLSEEELQPYLHAGLSLAAINAPMQCVLAGPQAAVERVERQLSLAGVRCQPLATSHAFHSAMMDPILAEFTSQVALARPRPPQLPFISNVTGQWITAEQATRPEYWAQHLRQPVRFSEGLATLLAEPQRVLLEVGPGQVLSRLARRHPAAGGNRRVLSSLPVPQDTPPASPLAYEALGRLWQAGVRVDWTGFHEGERRRRVPLPSYPFQRQRYWIAPEQAAAPAAQAEALQAPHELHPRPELRSSYVAPTTELERQLANLWEQVLGVTPIGVQDNFFELGGDSLLATQVAGRLRTLLGVEVPLSKLFEASTVADLARVLSELKAEQERQEQAHMRELLEAVPRRNKETGPAPASFAQQRLWVLDRLEGGTSLAYNVHTSVQFTGPLDLGLLERSIQEVVRRHEALRTTLTVVEGQPVQVVQPPPPVELRPVDLSGLPPAEQQAQVERLTHEESRWLFDLERGPLLRCGVLRLAAHEHVVMVTMHHLVTDRWSMGVLVRELMALYLAQAEGRPSPLEPLPLQYSDYAAWQRQWLKSAEASNQLAHWRQRLTPLPEQLELPTDRPRPPVRSYQGACYFLSLPRALTRSLEQLAQREESTLFMVLLATFQVVLHRYSGQVDFALGTPIANRRYPELEGLIGFFVNTLVLRADLEGDPTFRELLGRVRRRCLEAYAHQDYPFEQLVAELQPVRDLGHNPLFQVMFSYQNTPRQDLALPGLSSRYLLVDSGAAMFDLTLDLREESPGEISGWLEYSTELFDAGTIERLYSHLLAAMQAAVEAPDRRLSELPLLSTAERGQVLAWSRGRAAPGSERVPRLFQAQVERTPQALALVAGEERLTYQELATRAWRLAHSLRGLGVGPEVPVALCLERSVELVVGLLATLEAGGVYVPLSPEAPRERLALMLEQVRAPVLLTRQSLAERFHGLPPRVVCVDAEATYLQGQPETPLGLELEAEGSAYVIFTSGSTGEPKGVCIAHGALANLVQALGEEYGLGPEDRVLQFSAPVFDVSLEELLPTLVRGAAVVLRRGGPAESVEELLALVRAQGITVLNLPAPYWHQWVDELEQHPVPPGVRLVVAGSQAVSSAHLRRWQERGPGHVRWLSAYGPTEATITASLHEPRGEPVHATPSVPLGHPLTGVELYVLDGHLRPVPVGVPGELYIGGQGLARGYLHRPELTAERFIPHPFSAEPGARLYRTGDKVRWLPGGALEYLGRLDFQVKVRGFRIEPREIEAALEAHPALAQAVVVAREDVPGDKRLVAYVVPRTGTTVEVGALTQALRQRLPEYMVPSAFMVLEALPLTPGGKVDRRALPAPEASTSRREYEAPRTSAEQALASLWAQVLRVERVGRHDSFFELGGHSLLATQLVARVRSTLQVELPLRALFEAPTLQALALRVEELLRAGGSTQAPALRRAERSGPLPLSFAQQRLWLLQQIEPLSTAYNMPAALRLEGRLDTEALRLSFQELVRRHESLRTTFASQAGQPVQIIAAPGPFSLPVVGLRALPASERRAEALRLASEEALRPFDLASGPLLRTSLLQLDEHEHVLLLNLHHIVSDGWSTAVLVRELGQLYEAFCAGQPSPLPELPMQYADYALWQRQWLQGEPLEAQLSYWRQQLAGAPQVLELPTDKPRPPTQSSRGARLSVRIPGALSESLRALCRKEGVTPFMALLATFQVLLSRYSGQQELLVGSPIAGRRHAELEGLIGFFVNTLVLRGRLEPRESFRSLLARVRDTTLAAYAHQDLPFERLVEELQPQRDLSRSPLFQAMFILQNAPLEEIPLATTGLSLRPLEVEATSAKFDLTLELAEEPEGISGALEYCTDLFEPATAARMVNHFQVLLQAIVANPDTRLADLPLLTEQERRQVLVEWNDTRADFPAEACIHHLFQARAARIPEAVALVFGENALTYAQLSARSSQLAHLLRSRGVGPEVRVGVYLERSEYLVVALLAVLEAGGAYVPLDPAWPAERLAYMLEDSGAAVLLTQRHLASLLPASRAHSLLLEEVEPLLAALSSMPPESGARAPNLAYVLYTSGSTGRPKGVMVPHRTVSNFFSAMDRRLRVPASGGTWLAVTSASFDISVLELLWTLTRGFKVVVQPDTASSGWFPSQVRRHGVTHLQCTPSLAQALLLEPGSAEALGCLQQLLIGGEALPPELARQLLRHLPPGSLLNMYGPTETTVWSSAHPVRQVSGSIPLGTPIANTSLYVLDGQLRPQPVGVPGELYIGGQGVVRGYLGRPELSAERFLPDPFASEPGARMYRTGDQARWRAEGTLEFLGRVDFQVKVRGFRIELGEIEARLTHHPSVRQAVVVVREDSSGDKRLVAYVVPQDKAPEDSELRGWLEQALPQYMVPSLFVSLPALPLTPNGKVDRKALPAPEASASRRQYVAPSTPTEQVLASLWAQVLRVERVGRHDSFFELGGDSLLGLRLVSLVGQAGLMLSLRQLFQHPTLAELASSVEAIQQSPPVQEVSEPTALPLAPNQHVSFATEDPDRHVWNITSFLEVDTRPDPAVLAQVARLLAERHDALRVRSVHEPTGWRQYVVPPGTEEGCFVHVDLTSVPEPELKAAIEQAASRLQQSLDLALGPLMRLALFDLGPERPCRVLFLVHHTVCDGHSFDILLEEALTAWQQLQQGQPVRLPPRTASLLTYTRELVELARSEPVRSEAPYWLSEERRQAAPLPVDFPSGVPTGASLSWVHTSLDPERTQALLRSASPERDVWVNDLLLTALARAVGRWSGQERVLVDLHDHGRQVREGMDLSRTVGWLNYLYPVVLETGTALGTAEAVKLTRQRLRAVPHRGLGHGLLRYLCEDEALMEQLARMPQAQLLFNYRGHLTGPIAPQAPGLRPARESSGLDRSLRVVLRHRLMINAQIAEGQLHLEWVYSESVHRRATIEALAQRYLQELEQLCNP